MTEKAGTRRQRGPVALAELVGGVIDPVTAQRGFATAELIAAWPDLVGPLHASYTAPEKIVWPRRDSQEAATGTLVIRVDGPRSIFVQHDLPQIRERINTFFGYAAIGQIRLIQAPVATVAVSRPKERRLSDADAGALAERLADVEDDALRAALERLGREVLGDRRD